MKHVVILGAGYAGIMSALRLSHTARKHNDVQITLVNAADTFVERIRQHEVAANNPPKVNRIPDMVRGTGILFKQAWVTAINPQEKTVEIQHSNQTEMLHYDKLVYALGSFVNREAVSGVSDHAYTLDSHSTPLLANRMKTIAQKSGQVIVIGGGLTGIEAATELAEAYPAVNVTLLTRGKLGETLAQSAQDYLHKIFAEMRITVRENVAVREVMADSVQLTNGEILASAATVWAAGFSVSPLAKEAGLAVNTSGQIIVDPYLRSVSHPDVYAAGDAMNLEASSPLQIRMSCQAAMPVGSHVGDNLAAWLKGETQQVFRFGYTLHCISLGQKRGLAQWVHPDDRMADRINTGWQGWLIKRVILKFTLWSLKLERIVARAYMWPQQLSAKPQASAAQPIADY